MRKQAANFAVETQKGIVTNVGKSVMVVPKSNFKGTPVKWYQDKRKNK